MKRFGLLEDEKARGAFGVDHTLLLAHVYCLNGSVRQSGDARREQCRLDQQRPVRRVEVGRVGEGLRISSSALDAMIKRRGSIAHHENHVDGPSLSRRGASESRKKH